MTRSLVTAVALIALVAAGVLALRHQRQSEARAEVAQAVADASMIGSGFR